MGSVEFPGISYCHVCSRVDAGKASNPGKPTRAKKKPPKSLHSLVKGHGREQSSKTKLLDNKSSTPVKYHRKTWSPTIISSHKGWMGSRHSHPSWVVSGACGIMETRWQDWTWGGPKFLFSPCSNRGLLPYPLGGSSGEPRLHIFLGVMKFPFNYQSRGRGAFLKHRFK